MFNFYGGKPLMPNDERILETMPDGALGLIPLKSCEELGAKVDQYLVGWREKREHAHKNEAAFKGYHRDSYIISTSVPRFGTGEAKGVIKEAVRGYDLYLIDGPGENIKITTPEDFYTMRAILEAKENEQIYGLE